MVSDKREPERRPGGAARASENSRKTSVPAGSSAPAPQRAATTSARPQASAAAGGTRPSLLDDGHRSGLQRFLLALGCLATVGVLLAACTIGYFNWRLGQIRRIDLHLAAAAAGAPQNYLIVGSDTRSGITKTEANSGAFLNDPEYAGNPNGAGARSDTIMVLRVDPSKSSAQLLSLPRDLYVPISGTDHKDKINAAFGLGQKTLIQTVQDQFGIVINHYVEVDFVGFQRLIDAIGGVKIYFDKQMWDGHTGLDISTVGCHTLNGEQALAFARSRYLWYNTLGKESVDTSSLRYLDASQMEANGWQYDGMSDLSRISRQQMLIRTAIPLAEHKAFRNPATLDAVMRSVVDSVTFDKGLSTSDLIGLAERFKGFDEKSLVTYAFPATPETLPVSGDVLLPDFAKAEPILRKFRDGTDSPESAVTVRVLNGSGVASQAANVAGALQRVGFGIDSTADASAEGIGAITTTQVRYSNADLDAAKLVASHLSAPVELVPTPGLKSGIVEVVTGSNFTTVSTLTRKLTEAELPKATPSTTTHGSTSSSSSSSVVGVVPNQKQAC